MNRGGNSTYSFPPRGIVRSFGPQFLPNKRIPTDYLFLDTTKMGHSRIPDDLNLSLTIKNKDDSFEGAIPVLQSWPSWSVCMPAANESQKLYRWTKKDDRTRMCQRKRQGEPVMGIPLSFSICTSSGTIRCDRDRTRDANLSVLCLAYRALHGSLVCHVED
jgi:hypothetical protein